MSQNVPFDQSIPVLTEVFGDTPSAPARRAEAVPAAPAQDGAHSELETRAIGDWTEPQWALLERRLSERLLQQLQGRVDVVLEQSVRESMEEVLSQAIAGLTADIRAGLQETIEKIVLGAVTQEISHLQALKK